MDEYWTLFVAKKSPEPFAPEIILAENSIDIQKKTKKKKTTTLVSQRNYTRA